MFRAKKRLLSELVAAAAAMAHSLEEVRTVLAQRSEMFKRRQADPRNHEEDKQLHYFPALHLLALPHVNGGKRGELRESLQREHADVMRDLASKWARGRTHLVIGPPGRYLSRVAAHLEKIDAGSEPSSVLLVHHSLEQVVSAAQQLTTSQLCYVWLADCNPQYLMQSVLSSQDTVFESVSLVMPVPWGPRETSHRRLVTAPLLNMAFQRLHFHAPSHLGHEKSQPASSRLLVCTDHRGGYHEFIQAQVAESKLSCQWQDGDQNSVRDDVFDVQPGDYSHVKMVVPASNGSPSKPSSSPSKDHSLPSPPSTNILKTVLCKTAPTSQTLKQLNSTVGFGRRYYAPLAH